MSIPATSESSFVKIKDEPAWIDVEIASLSTEKTHRPLVMANYFCNVVFNDEEIKKLKEKCGCLTEI
jgi:hypothetical protein